MNKHYIGLDLGTRSDYTALTIVERFGEMKYVPRRKKNSGRLRNFAFGTSSDSSTSPTRRS
ncbi:MAG: hypothetical protein BMS9Abin05_2283 [Rhodothermia bacterium]|nr:MAG: hypothetical protein BMS9Abin05_2283 [Rhodothermia bacterium]